MMYLSQARRRLRLPSSLQCHQQQARDLTALQLPDYFHFVFEMDRSQENQMCFPQSFQHYRANSQYRRVRGIAISIIA